MTSHWLEREALITVKAYPNPSAKYFETVCVAAITREEGWVRLYPVSFRALPENQRFKKYQRVRLRMRKHPRDRRSESYRPDENSMELGAVVGTKDKWRDRWRWIRPTLGSTMCGMQHSGVQSLGCIKPRQVDRMIVEEVDPIWSSRKQSAIDQLALFDPVEKRLEKIPYVFKYSYRCEEPDCRGHTQSIIDWELMELYRKVAPHALNRKELEAQIRKKYIDELCGSDKDTYFFVGNHSRFPNTFMVLGVFWPPRADQQSLF